MELTATPPEGDWLHRLFDEAPVMALVQVIYTPRWRKQVLGA
jgi:hypothetical protein